MLPRFLHRLLGRHQRLTGFPLHRLGARHLLPCCADGGVFFFFSPSSFVSVVKDAVAAVATAVVVVVVMPAVAVMAVAAAAAGAGAS